MLSRIVLAIKRSRAEVALAYDGQRIRVAKGKFTARAAAEASEVLARCSAPPCEIHLLATGEVEFDRYVPAEAHQPLRNVIGSP